MSNVTVLDVVTNPNALNDSNFYGFFAWFCKDSALKNRAKSLIPKIKFMYSKGLVSIDTPICLKNNAPCVGKLYDDVRFLNEEGDVIGGLIANGRDYEACIWLFIEGKHHEFEFSSWKDLKAALSGDNPELIEKVRSILLT